MVLYDPSHKPTDEMRRRVTDLAVAGIPVYLIAKIVRMDDETLTKYYDYELKCAQAEAVQRIARVVAIQAEGGDSKAQALYLKTQGAKFGWVEKQVVETSSADETQDLKDKLKMLEDKFQREY